MPEVQFNQLSTSDEYSAVTYDRGILLQTVMQAQVQHTVPLDVTVCHGPGIIGAPSDDPKTSRENPSEEMDYTKCCNSVFSSAVANVDQARLFSGDTGIDLDITCSQQEVLLCNYPNAQLSSPENLEHSGKMDSKSFLMSLESKPSSIQTHEVIQHTKDSMTPTNSSNAYRKRQPLGEITDVQIAMKTSQGGGNQHSNLDENVELTACHSYKGLENVGPKTNRRSIYEPADIDVTSCYGAGLLKSSGKQELNGPDEARSQMAGAPTNLSVKRNSFGTDLQPLVPSEQTAQLDVTNCYVNGILLAGKRVSVPGAHQTEVPIYSTDRTESLDLTVCEAQQEYDCDENLELTACHSYEVLDNSIPKTHQKSICEPAELDVTSCYGPGLIKSPEDLVTSDYVTDSNLERRAEATVVRLHKNTLLNNAQDLRDPEDAGALVSQTSRLATIANGDKNSINKDYSTHQLPEHTDQLDTTRCYGEGILPHQRLPITGADHTLVFNPDNVGNTDSLDLTVCHPQQGQDTDATSSDSLSQNHQNDQSMSYNGSSKIDSSAFLKFLGAKQHSSGTDNDEHDDDMDLTISGYIATEDIREQQKPVKPKLSMESAFLCAKTNEVVTDRSNSSGFRNAYLIKNPFRKSTGEQEQVSNFHENLELTVCHSQPVLDSNTQKTKRKSLYEPADLEVTSCFGPGLIHSPEKEETSNDVFKSALNLSRSLRAATTAKKFEGNASFHNARDVPALNQIKQQESDFNDNLDLTTCYSEPFVRDNSDINLEQGLDKRLQKVNRKSFYEPADIDVTSCHGVGLFKSFAETSESTVSHSQYAVDNNTQKRNRRSVYEPTDLDVTSCHGPGLVKSNLESLQLGPCTSEQVLDIDTKEATRQSFYEHADLGSTPCSNSGLIKTPEEPVMNDDVGKTRLNLTERTEARCHSVSPNTSLSKADYVHYPEELLQTSRALTHSNTSLESTDYNADKDVTSPHPVELTQSAGDPITSDDVDRKLSIICEESVSEVSRRELREDGNVTELEELQNTTQ